LESPAEENRSTLDLRRRKNRSDLPRSFFSGAKNSDAATAAAEGFFAAAAEVLF
jgi:hypothetical protein